MTLIDFRELLKTVCDSVSHIESYKEALPRIVYAESGRVYYRADNKVSKKLFKVDVHFYTNIEFDPIFEALENLFSENNIPFDLAKIEHGSIKDIENVTHYLFECEV